MTTVNIFKNTDYLTIVKAMKSFGLSRVIEQAALLNHGCYWFRLIESNNRSVCGVHYESSYELVVSTSDSGADKFDHQLFIDTLLKEFSISGRFLDTTLMTDASNGLNYTLFFFQINILFTRR